MRRLRNFFVGFVQSRLILHLLLLHFDYCAVISGTLKAFNPPDDDDREIVPEGRARSVVPDRFNMKLFSARRDYNDWVFRVFVEEKVSVT